jgi:peptidoglycan/xylan/chitin deacetylase (PgdA/CDA1 family)
LVPLGPLVWVAFGDGDQIERFSERFDLRCSKLAQPALELGVMISCRIRFMIAICFAWLLAMAGPSVAITFDDLPAAGSRNPSEDPALTTADVRAMNEGILRTLRAHHAPSIGFVNERGVSAYPDAAERRAILSQWTAAGMDLGNHTFSHPDFNTLSMDEFRVEVESGEASIVPLMRAAGRRLSFFRFPMNHTGDTQEKKDAAARYLHERGYALAVCTIENEDYEFESAYRVALARQDAVAAEHIRAAYLDYTQREIDYYRAVRRQLFGRDTAQVMFLHVNRLNAALLVSCLRRVGRMRRHARVRLRRQRQVLRRRRAGHLRPAFGDSDAHADSKPA